MELVYCTACGTVYVKKVIDKEQKEYREQCGRTLIGSGVISLKCGHYYTDLKTVEEK